ncbi:MAG: calcium-binding protein [Pseudomonadota bacterium]
MPTLTATSTSSTIILQSGDHLLVPASVFLDPPGDGIATAGSGAGFASIENLGWIFAGEDAVDFDLDDGVITNSGTMVGFGGDGVSYSGTGTLTINNSGTIRGFDDAIDATLSTGLVKINNTGLIETVTGQLVSLRNPNLITSVEVNNEGTMRNGTLELGRGEFSSLTNSGVIENLNGTVIDFFGGGSNFILNSGLIDAGEGGVAIETAIGLKVLVNTGKIVGDITSFGSHRQLINSGDIFGDITQFDFSGELINSGLISGDVQMGGRADVVTNSGTIVGDVNLFVGADTYIAEGDGVVLGQVRGGGGFGVSANDTIIGGWQDDDFLGEGGDDVLQGNGGDDRLDGGDGNDEIDGGDGNDTILGGAGADQIDAGDGLNTVWAGDGADFVVGGADADRIYGEGGSDTILAGFGNDFVSGGDGVDGLSGSDGHDRLLGGADNDTLNGGSGNDFLDGGSENDILIGGSGEDGLVGGSGADSLVGGTGDDTLTGGADADTFVFGLVEGFDVVTDFEDGIDRIDIAAYGLTAADFAGIVAPAFFDLGGDTLLDLASLGGSGWVYFEGLDRSAITVDDFLF